METLNKDGYRLVFEDAFAAIDPDTWDFVKGGGGFGNNESQVYTDSPQNVFTEDGLLHIRARKEADGGYTSARMTTLGRRSWRYGIVEVTAALPKGKGAWPAIWMLPDEISRGVPWPLCGEIDIMEQVGCDPEHIHFSLHSEKHNHMLGTQRTKVIAFPGADAGEHVYALRWERDEIAFYIDGVQRAAFCRGDDGEPDSRESWPFDQPFFLLLNLAVGGSFGGPVDDGAFPYEMTVRLVRVWQKEEEGC